MTTFNDDGFFGTAVLDNKTNGRPFTIKDGDNKYRVLPPCGNLARDGIFGVKYNIHWGWNGEVNKWTTFSCIERSDYKTKVILQACPACDEYRRREKLMQAAKKDGESQGLTGADLKEWLTPHTEWLRKHNVERKFNLNAMDETGSIKLLKIGVKHWHALREEVGILAARKIPIDAFSITQGVFFNFHRLHSGNDFLDTVKTVTESRIIEGNSYETPKLAPLSEEVLRRARKEMKQLDNLSRTLTFSEIKRIVVSGGNPQVVDEVFGIPEGKGNTSSVSEQKYFEEEESSEPVVESMPVSAVVPQAAEPVSAPVDEMAALRAELAALKAAKAAGAYTVMQGLGGGGGGSAFPSSPTPVSAALKTADLSDEEFMAKFGKKG